ncbi:hypothetical protein MMC14_000745 [Varicellaria rhodocarpa]|nr:hypothetical protein [Varicellaria rhodocarpa]
MAPAKKGQSTKRKATNDTSSPRKRTRASNAVKLPDQTPDSAPIATSSSSQSSVLSPIPESTAQFPESNPALPNPPDVSSPSKPPARSSILSFFPPTASTSKLPSPPSSAPRPTKKAAPKKATPKKTPSTKATPISPPPDTRPLPSGTPAVWADGRQALCDTLPYFRSFQSAAYTTRGVAFGFLLDGDNGERPYLDNEVAITRAGGGFERDEDGVMKQAKDHKEDNATLQSMIKTMKDKIPIVMIVGSHNSASAVQLPHRYCVMDYFQVTDVWTEKVNKRVCYRYRFEKVNLAKRSWWSPQSDPDPLPSCSRDLSVRAHREACGTCQEVSTQVYQEGWMCLTSTCARFFELNGKQAPKDLTYNPDFLNQRTAPPLQNPSFDLKPAPLPANSGSDPTYAFSQLCWKGMVCATCGRCSSRTQWDAWFCGNRECDFKHQINQPILSALAVMDPQYPLYQGHAMPVDTCSDPKIPVTTRFLGHWRVTTFELCPGNTITHFQANQPLNAMGHGADETFMQLQRDNCLGLERRMMSGGIVAGGMLTNHFATNFGYPYKYVVDVASKPFQDAPEALLHSLQRLTWAGKQAAPDGSFRPFNELLAVGYFETGSMKYHDDGESSLGPTVATLSLGGRAQMSFRKKRKYCTEYNKALVNLTLLHGDITVMHGAEMQKYYEHGVVHDCKLRFALTCRFIKPSEVDPSQHWKGNYDTSIVSEYDGDVKSFEEGRR